MNYTQLLKTFNDTKLEIFEVFIIQYREAVELFIGDMFGDVYSENVDTYDEDDASEIIARILRNDPNLEKQATKEEIVELLAILYHMEYSISDTYTTYSELGVDFNVIDQNNFNFKLIEEIFGNEDQAHHFREEYLYTELTFDELKERLSSTI
ncbi:hypothetical protein AAAC51_07280 [Priestia megaterium]